MSAKRTSVNEAWIVSVVLHVGLVAAIIALVGRTPGSAKESVVINTRDTSHDISIVLLEPRSVTSVQAVATKPIEVPQTVPVASAAADTTTNPIRPVTHQEPAPIVANALPVAAPVPSFAKAGGSQPSAATPPARPLPPPGASTAFFGVPAIGKSVVFVIDRSASMGLDGRLDRARRELAASLQMLPPSARFQVIAYNRVVEPLHVAGVTDLLPATPDAVDAAIAAIDRMAPEGGTDHVRALNTALALSPDVIYFLTDEDELTSSDAQSVTRLNRGRACIHAFCLISQTGGETPMQLLARLNRGQFKLAR